MPATVRPTTSANSTESAGSAQNWGGLAQQVLDGQPLSFEQALAVLDSPDEELLDLVAAAAKVRRHYFGNTVQLYFLMNAKSGLCPEDCGYCSQSKVSDAEIPRYNLLNAKKLLDGARIAHEQGSKTYCIVISARAPNEREINAITQIVPQIKSQYGLNICACLGLLTAEHARRLKECGVDKVNHNLNTSEEYYGQVCSTHSYQDRVETLQHVRNAGLELCSGGIIGMGESHANIVQMAFALRDLQVESIPLNFLNPIDGTPLAGQKELNPRFCLKALCMMRLVNPTSELRIAGGREMHLASLQPLGLHVANSIFVGDYLTTKGQAPEADYQMIRDLGFVVTRQDDVQVELPGASSSSQKAATATADAV
ncbi:MAG: biotin synthase BioB [Planctomycetota bacterium]|nr:biotin synthase BioB [Planctomycetota bacterium]